MAVVIVISNAFNSIDTSAVLREVRAYFKIMGRWLDCHRYDRLLFEGVHTVAVQITICVRVQQDCYVLPWSSL